MKKLLVLCTMLLCSCQANTTPVSNSASTEESILINDSEKTIPEENTTNDNQKDVSTGIEGEGEATPTDEGDKTTTEEKTWYSFEETESSFGGIVRNLFPTILQFGTDIYHDGDTIEITYLFGMEKNYNHEKYMCFYTEEDRKEHKQGSIANIVYASEYDYVTFDSFLYFEDNANIPLIDHVNTTKGGYDHQVEKTDNGFRYSFEFSKVITLSYSDFIKHENKKDNLLNYHCYTNISNTGERVSINSCVIYYEFDEEGGLRLHFGKGYSTVGLAIIQ